MIKKMILEVGQYLPLKILDVDWDGTIFHMHGIGWSFNSLSSWRITEGKKMIIGCFDKFSKEQVHLLKNEEILRLSCQDENLKIDPIFCLSNGQQIEIFSTDTYEPWTLHIHKIGSYVPTPSSPSEFSK